MFGEHSGIQRVFSTLTSLSSYNTQWLRRRITPKSQIFDSVSSLSEGQMQGKHPFCRGCATRRRVQRLTGLVKGGLATGYALVSSRTLGLIIYPVHSQSYDRGWTSSFSLVMAVHEDPTYSAAIITSKMNSSSRTTMAMCSMTLADLKRVVKTSWRLSENSFIASYGRDD